MTYDPSAPVQRRPRNRALHRKRNPNEKPRSTLRLLFSFISTPAAVNPHQTGIFHQATFSADTAASPFNALDSHFGRLLDQPGQQRRRLAWRPWQRLRRRLALARAVFTALTAASRPAGRAFWKRPSRAVSKFLPAAAASGFDQLAALPGVGADGGEAAAVGNALRRTGVRTPRFRAPAPSILGGITALRKRRFRRKRCGRVARFRVETRRQRRTRWPMKEEAEFRPASTLTWRRRR